MAANSLSVALELTRKRPSTFSVEIVFGCPSFKNMAGMCRRIRVGRSEQLSKTKLTLSTFKCIQCQPLC